MSSFPPGFEARLAALRVEYEKRLPGQVAQALRLVDACEANPGDSDALSELRSIFHTLAGNSATFGRAGLGARAKELELAVIAIAAQGQRDPSAIAALRGRVESLAVD